MLRKSRFWVLLLVIPLFVVGGCSGARSAQSPKPSPTHSPTQVMLTVMQAVVQRIAGNGAEKAVEPGDPVEIQTNDRVRAEEKGHAFLEFPHQLEVELVRSTEIKLTDIHQGPSGSIEVALRQASGHTFTRAESGQDVHVVINTDYADVTALTNNAQFLVCHVPGILTCVVAANGLVQVGAHGEAVTLKPGEVTYVVPNQPPVAPFCADMGEIRDWWSLMRGSEDTSDLSSMLAGWMNRSCSTPSAPSPATSSALTVATPTVPAAVPTREVATPSVSPSPIASSVPAATTPVASPVQAKVTVSSPSATISSPTAPPVRSSAAPAAPPTPTASPTPAAAALLPSLDAMVKIGKGSYVLGVPEPDSNHVAATAVNLPEFWIDKYEVTNVQYEAFLDKTGATAPATWPGGSFPAGRDMHPAAGLTWDDAAAYCAWAGKRLPSEAEWEAAGRGAGTEPPLYPWGPDPTAGGKTGSLPQRDTYPVGSLEFNQSSSGVHDLVGNVWQWVGEVYSPTPAGSKVLRGGRHGLLQDLAFFQSARPDDDRFTRLAGVRCAADKVAGE